jgi:hypothetical protein
MASSQVFASSPVHSMVFDVSDKTWLKYFTPEEIQEIKNHQEYKELLCFKVKHPSISSNKLLFT